MIRLVLIGVLAVAGCSSPVPKAEPQPAPEPEVKAELEEPPPAPAKEVIEREPTPPELEPPPPAEPEPKPEPVPVTASSRPAPTVVAKMPVLINQVTPEYPKDAKALGLQGEVVLRLQIDATGTVTSVRVLKSEAAELSKAAETAAFKLKFRPAEDKAGNPVATDIRFAFQFRIE